MFRTLRTSMLAALAVVVFAPLALAQTGMIKGKVVDKDGKPVVGAKISIEFTGGINRKMESKTDRKGEFIQIGLQSGAYKVTAADDKLGSQSFPTQVRVGQTAEVNFVLGAPAAGENPKAVELKKLFEDGVAASRAGQHDVAIEKFNAAAAVVPNCHDCYYNIGYAYLQKKDDKQAEASWLKAVEIKPDYAEALNGLATLYNNQKRFDEATVMSQKAAAAAAAGGTGGSADAIYNQGIILWNQGKIPEAKAKFEEALKANPNHPESNFQFGMALLNEGKLQEAVASFEKYLQLAPEGQYAAQAKAMVAQLKK